MPLFNWKGINLEGKRCHGTSFAVSQEDLDGRLLRQQVALIDCSEKAIWLRRTVRQSIKIQFFKELCLLLKAGILLPDALHILEAQLTHPTLQEVVQELHMHVSKGVLLHDTMKKYSDIFDLFMVQMVQVGHENGKLAHSLEVLSTHLETEHEFRKKLRSLALAPISTFIFFLLIALVIFVFIIPQFASIFAAAGKELPTSTRVMLSLAEWLRSLYMPLVVLISVLTGLVLYRWSKIKRVQRLKERLFCSLPFVGALVRYNNAAHFFQALSLLLEGGVPLVSALKVTHESCNSLLLTDVIEVIEHDIRSGSSLSQSLFATNSSFFEHETIVMVTIGEESGYLSPVLERAAHSYRQKVRRIFSVISTLFQPMLLVILGLLVALLVFSVYVPLFNLSHVVPSELNGH